MDKNRRSAFYTLMDTEKNLAYSNIALKHRIRRGKPDSPAFVREMTYGVLKNRLYLDYIISNFVKTPLDKTESNDLTLLRMGLYQLIFMNSVPDYAAINETVDLAKRFSPGREGFINGVLRQFQRDKEYVKLPDKELNQVDYLCKKYSYASWIVELWLSSFGFEETEALLAAGNQTPEFSIRINRLRTGREEAVHRLNSRGFNAKYSDRTSMGLLVEGSNLLSTRMYINGFFSVQDESSQIAADIADPQPGDTVIDVCAAPGGKTLAMAEKMGDVGKIHAWDLYKRKLSLIEHDAKRLGVSIVETHTWDAARINTEMVGAADVVFADVPCSGLGVVRRKPEIKYKEDITGLEELYNRQLEILTASANYVKYGGAIVYATCTISPHENQNIINTFLKKNKSFERLDTVQLLPHIDHMDGFFICKMRRR